MCAEEMMRGLAVDLARDAEQCKKLHSTESIVDRGIEIDHGGRIREDHVVDLVSKFGR